MIALCLITLRPHKIWCDFLNSFDAYKIFIVVDDNDFDVTPYNNITFIKCTTDELVSNGFVKTNFVIKKKVSGWDKALFYFSTTGYDFVWFIEDDVFFHDQNTLLQIDKQFPTQDLLSNYVGVSDGDKSVWHWKQIDIKFSPPYYIGMMCAIRVSKTLLSCIKQYATDKKTLFFLEALFPTIAQKNNLCIENPIEFNIHYRHEFDEYEKTALYHPLKDVEKHLILRRLL